VPGSAVCAGARRGAAGLGGAPAGGRGGCPVPPAAAAAEGSARGPPRPSLPVGESVPEPPPAKPLSRADRGRAEAEAPLLRLLEVEAVVPCLVVPTATALRQRTVASRGIPPLLSR